MQPQLTANLSIAFARKNPNKVKVSVQVGGIHHSQIVAPEAMDSAIIFLVRQTSRSLDHYGERALTHLQLPHFSFDADIPPFAEIKGKRAQFFRVPISQLNDTLAHIGPDRKRGGGNG